MAAGEFNLTLPMPEPLEGALTVRLTFESEGAWTTPDQRDLAFVLLSVKARHPVIQDPGELTARGIPGGGAD